MPRKTDAPLGTLDLEKGLRSGSIGEVLQVIVVAAFVLLLANGAGLALWTQALPSGSATAAMSDLAAEWHQYTRVLGPARVYDAVKTEVRKGW